MDHPMTVEDAGGWAVAGVLTDLQGALLTTQPAEAGLAGAVELDGQLREAANDPRWEAATAGAARPPEGADTAV
jgi:hypothetical protein